MLNKEYQLRPYQEEGSKKIQQMKQCLNITQMGLGKSLMTLHAIFKSFTYPKILIVCPNKAVGVWSDELMKFFNYKSFVYSGNPKQRQKKLEELYDYDVVICSINMLEEIPNVSYFDAIVVDEYHELGLMNHKTQKYKLFHNYIKAKRESTMVVLLSGTPCRQGVKDFYAPLSLINKNIESYWHWINKHAWVLDGPFGKTIERNPKNIELFRAYLQVFSVKYNREEVLKDLPEKQRQVIKVDLDKYTQMQVETLIQDGILELDGGNDILIAPSTITKINAIRQLLIQKDSEAYKTCVDMVIDHLYNDDYAIVFCPYNKTLDDLNKTFMSYPDFKTQISTYVLNGRLNAEEFAMNVRHFQKVEKGKKKVLLCNVNSGASFTATNAHKCWFLGFSYDANKNEQSEDRLCRIGQTRGVICYYIVSKDTIDEDVIYKLNQKKTAADLCINTQEIVSLLKKRYS